MLSLLNSFLSKPITIKILKNLDINWLKSKFSSLNYLDSLTILEMFKSRIKEKNLLKIIKMISKLNLGIQKIKLQFYKKKQHLRILNQWKIKSNRFNSKLLLNFFQLKKVLIKHSSFNKLIKIFNREKKYKRHLKF
jgi:hypothetical protein